MKETGISLNERIHTLDIIRGFALFGILLANMIFFKTLVMNKKTSYLEVATLPEDTLDAIATLFTSFFVTGKFYPMFSLLFGLGFYIFSKRLLEKDLLPKSLFIQRLLFLLVVGLVHLTFVWSGDILYTYALTGLFLPLFFHRQLNTLRHWIVWLLLGTSVLTFGLTFLMVFGVHVGIDMDPESVATMEAAEQVGAAVMSSGNYVEILQYRFWNESLRKVFFEPLVTIPTILPLFLIGLYMGKTRMFQDVKKNMRRWRMLLLISASVGLPLIALQGMLMYDVFSLNVALTFGVVAALQQISGVALMLVYVSLFVLLLQKDWLQKLFMPLAVTGRMALTNYLMQSLVCTTIFYGYGLGLFGKVSSSQGVLIACIIFACQVILSHFYLKRFKQGPMETLWRKWTYRNA
ncbi:DUF418 domain-containing protein [Shouchella lonarensis]|uniref:DUF418 domain-containing protein n=1 Tax=Shouchella lonarensis TaxID=1464122 RepID=A0A1G6J4K9_9BACI|nr:DUF418 domain-containing protein [Shouchella lonarensis]SDC13563.1 uncharacterized protein SAMN05421737_105250 [Shouchella lonarensis]